MTALRNRVTTLRRRFEDVEDAKANHQAAKQRYFQEIHKQKKTHWKDFLNDPNNIWKANSYTRLANTGTTIPTLTKGESVARKDEDKAKMLMETFFPVPPDPIRQTRQENGQSTRSPQALPTAPEMGLELELEPGERRRRRRDHVYSVEETMAESKGMATGPVQGVDPPPASAAELAHGEDCGPTQAWKTGLHTETYNPIPANHFGGRPKRSSEQAVDIIVEQIHKAWRGGKVLSLVTFDVQGAFNGVHPGVLCERMQQRQIPAELVGWVHSFCSNRTASVVVGQYKSETIQIKHAGIPQGSPLSPILYVLYKAGLVEQADNQHGGSIGFIDDYTTWVVGPTAELNTQKIQHTVIPKAEAWARESGATFEAKKTGFVHFSRQPRKLLRRPPLKFNGAEIKNTDRVKILGVTLDQKLRMHAHVERVTTAATAKCLAMARLKGLRPKQMRQLDESVVVPTTDYAASSWFSQDRRGISRLVNRMERVQKMGAKIILRAFNGVALRILEAEASLEPVRERLTRKVAAHLASLTSLQESNLLRQCMQDIQKRAITQESPLQETLWAYRRQCSPRGSPTPIPLRTWIIPPWKDRAEQCLAVEQSRVREFLDQEQGYGTAILYTDASARNGVSGCAVVMGSGRGPIKTIYQATIGWASTCPVLSAELQAIKQTIDYICTLRNVEAQ
ncbi:hypothetical protein E4T39_08219 [Aureobasidium subglaciale]|nr:hypothetical protein E4T39_08219 [Aureobasidium subglaciale]